jgi:C4-dicarboxylate transporter DctQ subunit
MKSFYTRIFDPVLDGLALLSGALVAAIPMLIVYDAVLRILEIGASVWVNDVSAIFIVYMTFLAAPWLLRERGHIYVTVIADRIGPRLRGPLNRAVNVICMLVCVYLAYKATTVVIANVGRFDVSAIQTPRWVRFLPLPIGFALLSLQFLRVAIYGEDVDPHTPDVDARGAV